MGDSVLTVAAAAIATDKILDMAAHLLLQLLLRRIVHLFNDPLQRQTNRRLLKLLGLDVQRHVLLLRWQCWCRGRRYNKLLLCLLLGPPVLCLRRRSSAHAALALHDLLQGAVRRGGWWILSHRAGSLFK